MNEYELHSRLLRYPDQELLDARMELAEQADGLPVRRRRELAPFMAYWVGRAGSSLQQDYVETFDFDRRASLYLTYHSHGDRRQRGQALVRLKRFYAAAGLELAGGELPDYLPALLEFASVVPGASELLQEQRPALELVRARLAELKSPWRLVLDAVVATLPALTPSQLNRVHRLAQSGPPSELVGMEAPA